MAKRVLILQKSESDLQTLAGYVENIGCNVDTARTNQDAEKLVLTWEYDLLIISAVLSGAGASGFCKFVRREFRQNAPPIIITSPIFTGTLQLEAKTKWGADEFLVLPAPVPIMMRIIKYHLGEESERPDTNLIMQRAIKLQHSTKVHKPGRKKIPPKGDLSDHSLKKVLTVLARGKRTGRLIIDSENQDRFELYGSEGKLVSVKSPFVQELSLGDILIKNQILDSTTLRPYIDRMAQEKIMLGQALLEGGALKKAQIIDALTMQCIEKGIYLLGTKKGKYAFKKDQITPDIDFPVEISLPQLLYENCRKKVTEDRFRKKYEDRMKLSPTYNKRSPFNLDDLELPDDQAAFIRRLEGKRTIYELLKKPDFAEVDLMSLIHCLCQLKILRLAD